MKKERELRMYFLVMYNISPIQKSIQAGHCVEEYSDKYSKTKLYKEYRKHKTWVVLDGGTSNNGIILCKDGQWYDDETKLGTMELHEKYLIDNNIPYASFHEPDLNNALSALCFICDEKVFDWETYPPFIKWATTYYHLSDDEKEMKPPYDESENLKTLYLDWIDFVGGEQNAKLKELIYGKKLA